MFHLGAGKPPLRYLEQLPFLEAHMAFQQVGEAHQIGGVRRSGQTFPHFPVLRQGPRHQGVLAHPLKCWQEALFLGLEMRFQLDREAFSQALPESGNISACGGFPGFHDQH